MTDAQMTAFREIAASFARPADETFRGYLVTDLQAAFNALTQPDNWKGRLYGIILLSDLVKAEAAAAFFAGSTLTAEYTEPETFGAARKCFVTGPGYYASVGA